MNHTQSALGREHFGGEQLFLLAVIIRFPATNR